MALLVGFGALGPLVAVTAVGWWGVRRFEGQLVSERQRMAAVVAEGMDHVVHGAFTVLSAVPAWPGFDPDDADPGPEREALRQAWLRSGGSLEAVLLLGPDGSVRLAEPESEPAPALALLELPEVRSALATGRLLATTVPSGARGPMAVFLAPERDFHARLRSLVVGVPRLASASWAAPLARAAPGPAGWADLVDEQGQPLVSPSPRATDGDVLAVEARLSLAPWRVRLSQPRSAAFGPALAQRRVLSLLAPALLAVALAFAWGAARSVTQPLGALSRAAGRIAAGDLEARISSTGEDEIGRLARALEAMRVALQASLAEVRASNRELEGRVAERTAELRRLYDELRARDDERRELLRKLIAAQEEERRRIARELHDETSQNLTVLALGLEAAQKEGGGAAARLGEARVLAGQTLAGVHRLIYDLRPSVLDDLGLYSAIRWVAERHLLPLGVAVRCEFPDAPDRLPAEVETTLFRAAQEALANVARHARAERVLVQVEAAEGGLEVQVEDDGVGFEPAAFAQAAPSGRGLGLLGMRERMELLGGSVEVDSAPGQGTRVVLRVPLEGGRA